METNASTPAVSTFEDLRDDKKTESLLHVGLTPNDYNLFWEPIENTIADLSTCSNSDSTACFSTIEGQSITPSEDITGTAIIGTKRKYGRQF